MASTASYGTKSDFTDYHFRLFSKYISSRNKQAFALCHIRCAKCSTLYCDINIITRSALHYTDSVPPGCMCLHSTVNKI